MSFRPRLLGARHNHQKTHATYLTTKPLKLLHDLHHSHQERRLLVSGVSASSLRPVIQKAWQHGWTVGVLRDDASSNLLVSVIHKFQPSILLLSASHQRIDTAGYRRIDGELKAIFEESGTTDPDPWPDDRYALVLFTSGSTGEPKGVCHSRGNILRSAELFVKHFGLRKNDHLHCLAPIHAMSGLRSALLPLVSAVKVSHAAPENQAFLKHIDEIAELRPSKILCGPAFLELLGAYGTRLQHQLRSIDGIFCTGAPLKEAARQEVENNLKITVLNFYGLTETSGIVLAETREQERGAFLPPPCAGVQQLLIPSRINPGAYELHIASANLFLGYLGEKMERRASFNTGDLVRQEDDGSLLLIGRGSEAIKAPSTEWLYPSLLETWLKSECNIQDALVRGKETVGGAVLEVWLTCVTPFDWRKAEQTIAMRFGREYVPIAWHEGRIIRNPLGKVEALEPTETGMLQ